MHFTRNADSWQNQKLLNRSVELWETQPIKVCTKGVSSRQVEPLINYWWNQVLLVWTADSFQSVTQSFVKNQPTSETQKPARKWIKVEFREIWIIEPISMGSNVFGPACKQFSWPLETQPVIKCTNVVCKLKVILNLSIRNFRFPLFRGRNCFRSNIWRFFLVFGSWNCLSHYTSERENSSSLLPLTTIKSFK